jgi:hypothetical protein
MDEDLDSKLLSFVLKIRVFGYKFESSLSHSYLVDDVPSGTSSPIGQFSIDIRQMTLKQLRPMIQFDMSGHMNRRSLMFQEAMFIMRRLPNHFNKPADQWSKYLFGFVRKDSNAMTLIQAEDEDNAISTLIGATEYFDVDLAIVPLTQIPPDQISQC